MSHTARAVLDLGALTHNLGRVRELAPERRVMACIKADAYGHGLVRVARALDGAADALAVARVGEAMELLEAGVRTPVVLLEGVFTPAELEAAMRAGLRLVVHSPEQLALLEHWRSGTHPPLRSPVRVWLKIDSGMNRLGFRPEDAEQARQRLEALEHVASPVGLMTHLACADEPGAETTRGQIRQFEAITGDWPGERSLANSAAVVAWPEAHGPRQDGWVRPGLMLYGVSPLVGGTGGEHDLRPVMTLSTRLIAVKPVRAGERIGYGGEFVATRDMRLGIAAIGYGDGYPWRAFQQGQALVQGRRVPLVGRVSMDMLGLDLSALDAPETGSQVVLWGAGLPVEEVAAWAGSVPYELLCGITRRVDFEVAGVAGSVEADSEVRRA